MSREELYRRADAAVAAHVAACLRCRDATRACDQAARVYTAALEIAPEAAGVRQAGRIEVPGYRDTAAPQNASPARHGEVTDDSDALFT